MFLGPVCYGGKKVKLLLVNILTSKNTSTVVTQEVCGGTLHIKSYARCSNDEALYKDIQKPDFSKIISCEKLKVPITKFAALHRMVFSQIKQQRKHSLFRSNHMCLLALSCHVVMEIPENIKTLLVYKQEPTCHARGATTASGYLRWLIFDVCRYR